MAVSYSDVAGHIQVTYAEPKLNDLSFPTTNGGSALLAYQVEWDTTRNFNSGVGGQPLGAYQAGPHGLGRRRGQPLPGQGRAGQGRAGQGRAATAGQLGAEVQEVLVYSGTVGSAAASSSGSTAPSPQLASRHLPTWRLRCRLQARAASPSVSREAITSPGNGFRYRITFLDGLVREPAAGAARCDGERQRGLRLAQQRRRDGRAGHWYADGGRAL